MKKTKLGTKKPTLCYIGDLPDVRVDGVTKSFHYNLTILSEIFSIIQSPENAQLKANVWSKAMNAINFWRRSQIVLARHHPEVIYMNLPASTMGALKVVSLINTSAVKASKLVFHVHRGDFLQLINGSTAYMRLVRIIVRRSDCIISLSPSESDQLNELFDTDKFTALPNTIDSPKSLVEYQPKKSYFLFLSNYLKTKGIVDLLEAFQNLDPDLSLRCYGAYPNQLMEQELKKYEGERVKINGPIYNQEKIEAYHKAMCLVLPSYSEGQPLVILEAMRIGLPVIATDVGFIKEMLGDQYPYLIPSKNQEALEKALFQMSNDPRKSAISKELKNRYEEYFHPRVHKEKLKAIFSSIL